MIRILLSVASAILLSAMAVHGQTVDDIIAKNIQAHGGMEKVKSVQTIHMSGKFDAGSFARDLCRKISDPAKFARNKSSKAWRRCKLTTAKWAGK